MKKFAIFILTAAMVLGNAGAAFCSGETETLITAPAAEVGYKTTTLTEQDEMNQVDGLRARLTMPNYLGELETTLETRLGVTDATVKVLYVPNDKWDGRSYYSGVSVKLRYTGLYPLSGSADIVAWKDFYNYGFFDINGGTAVFDDSSLQMHFLEGPGLYTGISTLPYMAVETGVSDLKTALAGFPEQVAYTAVGYPFILVLDDTTIEHFLENGTLEPASSFEWPGLSELLDEARFEVEPPAAADAGLENFTHKVNYIRGMFLDMPYNAAPWYEPYVEKVVELSLMQGSSNGLFLPEGDVKLSEVVAMASRLHNIYHDGDGVFSQGPTWYNVYVNYAIKNGIIKDDDFKDFNRPATRAEMAYVFAAAVPKEALSELHEVNQLPDVTAATAYDESIFLLYRAGVLNGNPDGTFGPGNSITRAEAAAIISRIADKSLRK